MTTYYDNVCAENVNTVPVVRQLHAVFKSIPDADLLAALKAPTGRPGYTVEILWKTYIAMTVLGLPTFASLIRTLQNNPMIAVACGIVSEDGIPSKFAYSRFIHKLSTPDFVVMVKNVMRELTRQLYTSIPDFGKSVAIDSTDLKAWSNGNKKPASDKDATWAVKSDTAGKKKYYFGYKLHLLADTQSELPIAANITTASFADVRAASRVLSHARFTYRAFRPEFIICDAGYSSQKLTSLIKRQYRANPIIKVNPTHKKLLFIESKKWQGIYSRRSAIERMFSRLKTYRRLNNITVHGIRKVTVHCFLSLIVTQAQALYAATSNQMASVRQCVYAPA
ncbi:MAG: transposase [Dehalococcoidia bacterium]